MEQVDFNFLSDSKIKNIIERDYEELQKLAINGATKSIIIVSGGILESLLIDALVFAEELDFKNACQKSLFDLLKLAKDKKIIREDVLSNAIRNYRNLVHAGKEIRENIHFDSADADLAISAIKIVLRDLKNWYERERYLRQIEKNVMQSDEREKEFLLLFTSPKPTQPNQPEHPWLEANIYSTKFLLEGKNILHKLEIEDTSKEKYQLITDTIPYIEKFLNKTLQRTEIIIDLRNVAANNVGGSGASNNMVRR